MAGETLTPRVLNRALLARQGLLEAPDVPVVEAVESIGALQAQHWPALPVALWSRLPEFEAADLYGALDAGQLVVGTLLRGTLHMVSAREHPSYAVVTDMSGVTAWHRTKAEPSPKVETLRSKLVAYTASGPRTVDETCDFIEAWLAKHPGVIEEPELAAQRSYKWRPFRTSSAFVRAPADGRWGGKTPAAFLSASCPPGTADSPAPEDALAAVIRCHLRAFGPAAAEDVASWTGLRTPAVREAISRFGAALVEFSDEAGRTLYDLPDAPRPDPGVPAPVRFLPAFDSVLLAYDAKHRARILPDEYRNTVYERGNLRIKPTFLVDGLVAGIWSMETRRRDAQLTLQPFGRLTSRVRAALTREAERLAQFSQPAAATHQVVVDR